MVSKAEEVDDFRNMAIVLALLFLAYGLEFPNWLFFSVGSSSDKGVSFIFL